MPVHLPRAAIVAALVLSAACGAKAPPSSSPTPAASRSAAPAAPRAPRVRSDLITAEQAAESRGTTAYQVVERLHPMWLRRQGTATPLTAGEDIVVVYNDREIGGPEELRNVRVEQIISIQFFDAVMARARWGAGHEFGVIAVTGQ
jgi:hypothetical protein